MEIADDDPTAPCTETPTAVADAIESALFMESTPPLPVAMATAVDDPPDCPAALLVADETPATVAIPGTMTMPTAVDAVDATAEDPVTLSDTDPVAVASAPALPMTLSVYFPVATASAVDDDVPGVEDDDVPTPVAEEIEPMTLRVLPSTAPEPADAAVPPSNVPEPASAAVPPS
jgi:hypothetical protein